MEKIIFLLLIVRYLCYSSITINGLSCEMEESKREDCGYNGIDENECVNSRGCCWREIYQNPNKYPWCYHGLTIPTTIPTTILTTMPTTIPTTILTTIPTTISITILTTIPTTVPTTIPTTIFITTMTEIFQPVNNSNMECIYIKLLNQEYTSLYCNKSEIYIKINKDIIQKYSANDESIFIKAEGNYIFQLTTV